MAKVSDLQASRSCVNKSHFFMVGSKVTSAGRAEGLQDGLVGIAACLEMGHGGGRGGRREAAEQAGKK